MGYKREELLGKIDFDFFPNEQAKIFREKDEIVLRSLFENVNEEEFTDKSGRLHTIVTKKSLYVDGLKNKFIVGIISDVTERKQLENELKLMNQNLGERVWEEVNKNREKDLLLIKQSRQASMGDMIRNIAHQWRQPLNALGIIIQNFREQNDFGKLDKEYIDRNVKKAVDLVQFMSRTIDDFKDFFKPDKEITRFSVKDALFRAIAVVEASMKNNFIEIEIDLDKEVFANGFMNEYSQVVLNILSNAKDILLEKKPAKPLVKIILTETDGKSTLIIWNNGGEIPEDVITHIFEPYFTTKESGTGIGLYMSKMIIDKNMNGRISARNAEGGAEFRIVV
jgi:signal transduction histidine kinase